MATALAQRKPHDSKAAHTRKMEQLAKRLEHLSGCTMSIAYQPSEQWTDDPSSEGHLLMGHFFPDFEHELSEADFIHIDARKGDPAKQLAEELKRVANIYLGIAKRVKAGAARKLTPSQPASDHFQKHPRR